MSDKKHILHVLNARGGVDIYVRYLCEFLPSSQFTTSIARSTFDGEWMFINDKKEVISQYRMPMVREISPIKDLICLYKLYKLVKKQKPDIIHCHSAKGGVIGRIIAFLTKTPVVYTPHAFSYLSAGNPMKRQLFLSIEKMLKIKKRGLLLGCSVSETQRAIHDLGYTSSSAVSWVNSVPEIVASENHPYTSVIKQPYICTIGRPSYQKNLSFLVEAVFQVKKKVPSVHLVIMGIGHYSPEVDALKELIEKYTLTENITLVDWTDREHILSILSGSLFYVSSSLYEGLPYSLLEAMALSKTAVVSAIEGHVDLIENEKNGFTFQLNDLQTLVDRMVMLYGDEALNNKLGQEAKQTIVTHFSLPQNIDKIQRIYTSLLTNG